MRLHQEVGGKEAEWPVLVRSVLTFNEQLHEGGAVQALATANARDAPMLHRVEL